MTHLALDLAVAGITGICWGTGPHDHATMRYPGRERGGRRLDWWCENLKDEHLRTKVPAVTAVVVEAPYVSRTHPTGSISTIELHGAFKRMIHRFGLPYIEVENMTLKKFATGRGNASKDDMLAAARALGYDVDDHNAADAIHLWRWWAQRDRRAA